MIYVTFMLIVPQYVMITAERRAQLARSRSRQNIFQSPDTTNTTVTREIDFEQEAVESPRSVQRKQRPKKQTTNGDMKMSEAEELLKRLKEL